MSYPQIMEFNARMITSTAKAKLLTVAGKMSKLESAYAAAVEAERREAPDGWGRWVPLRRKYRG